MEIYQNVKYNTMVKVDFGGCSSFIEDAEYQEYLQKALSSLDVLENETGAGNDFLGWKHLPTQTPESLIAECEAIRDQWKAKGVDLVVVIGIGGSYLGAKCAIEALSHSFAKQLSSKHTPEIVFAGHNLSEEYTAELLDLMKERNVAAVVISKSGTTTEPAVAFRFIKQHIEARYGSAEAAERIVAVTDAHKGALKSLATQEGYRTFVIEDNVGGRFSVLTPVGLLPVAVAGFDISRLVSGALSMEETCSSKSPAAENPAAVYAAMRNALYAGGKKIEILVNFNPKLHYIMEWWKQLYGESEGKDNKGIFPAAVDFSTDLHSMGQWIQQGERTIFETVISVANVNHELRIPSDQENLDGLNYIAGKRIDEVNKMAELGTRLAHVDGGVPNMRIEMPKVDEYYIGQLFYFFEKACAISGLMLGINPFNQPGVEDYKKNMFALLDKPGYEKESEAIRERLK